MRLTVFVLIVLTLSGFSSTSPAADFRSEDVTVISLPFSDDLYVAGGKIVVTEPVAGDLLAAGGSLIVNGPVGADLQAAGGSLIVNGAVGDDLRLAGGDVTIASRIGGDLLVFGGSVTIPSGVVVEGDAVVGSGTLHLGGTIGGDLKVDAGTVNFSGVVKGNARFYVDNQVNFNGRIEGKTVLASRDIILGPAAVFENDLVYWRQDGEMDFDQVPVRGEVRFAPELEREEPRDTMHGKERAIRKGLAAVFSVFFFGTLLSGILAIVLAVFLFNRTIREAGEVLHLAFWKGLGVGVLAYVLLPIAAIIAMFTLVGIPIGLLIMAFFVFSVIFGRVITAMAFAAWMERRQAASWSTGRFILAAMGLFVVIKLVSLIPFIGWITVLLATLAGYGALVTALLEGRRSAF